MRASAVPAGTAVARKNDFFIAVKSRRQMVDKSRYDNEPNYCKHYILRTEKKERRSTRKT